MLNLPANHKEQVPDCAPRFGNAVSRWIGRMILRAMRHKITGKFPDEPKLVLACGPHTSNWDLLLALGTILALGVRINFMMKKEAFQNPLGGFFKMMGGIPIDRSSPKRSVVETLNAFKTTEKIWVAILPEGTRKPVKSYKAGFIRIARTADVPIFWMGLKGRERTLHLDKIFIPAENTKLKPAGSAIKQAEEIRQYCKENYTGMNPEND